MATSAVKSGCINEIISFIAPKILGGKNSMHPFGDLDVSEMHEVIKLSESKITFNGDDICVKSTLEK